MVAELMSGGLIRALGRMKRTLSSVLLFVALLFVSDEVRSQLQRLASERYVASLGSPAWLNSGSNLLFVEISIYAVVFAASGAVVAWRALSTISGAMLALIFGLAVPALSLFLTAPQPFHFVTHSPWWVALLGWANWYVPPIAALAGALSWNAFTSKGRHVRHAA
jgi:hypothetical protein